MSFKKTYLLGLEILQNSAQCPRRGGKGGVEAVDIGLLDVGLLLDAKADLKIAALIVSAVAAADQLLELSLVL
jgi:hypothetical protein